MVASRLQSKELAQVYMYLPTRWCDFHELKLSLEKVPNSALCVELVDVIDDMVESVQNDAPQKTAKDFITKLCNSIDIDRPRQNLQENSSQSQEKIGTLQIILCKRIVFSWEILSSVQLLIITVIGKRC